MASELGVQTIQHTNGTDALTIGSDGSVTAAQYIKQNAVPAFHAVLTSNTNITDTADFVFDRAYLNQGSHYSTSTGQFTAPVDGVYFLHFEGLILDTENDTADIRFFINGSQSQLATTFQENYTTGYRKCEMTAIAQLSASDTISVRLQSTGAVALYGSDNNLISNSGSGHTAFKGYLIG